MTCAQLSLISAKRLGVATEGGTEDILARPNEEERTEKRTPSHPSDVGGEGQREWLGKATNSRPAYGSQDGLSMIPASPRAIATTVRASRHALQQSDEA